VVIRADHADPGDAADAVAPTVAEFGRIDILVDNARVFTGGPLAELSAEDVDRTLAIDVARGLPGQPGGRPAPG
jgi:NAD(P)-dependent dehydrogenase (short-subunit alcohol dehydrogenase family)